MSKSPSHQSRLSFAGASLTLVPHHIDSVGPRVFLVLDTTQTHNIVNYTPEDLRFLAMQLILAADEASALARTAQRRRA